MLIVNSGEFFGGRGGGVGDNPFFFKDKDKMKFFMDLI